MSKTYSTGADRRPVFAGSAGLWFWVMNHQIASSTTMTIRMIAHIGKPLEVDAAAAGTRAAVAWAVLAADSALRAAELAAELAVELAAVAAFETVEVAP